MARQSMEKILCDLVYDVSKHGEHELKAVISDTRKFSAWLKDRCGSSGTKENGIEKYLSALVAAVRLGQPLRIHQLKKEDIWLHRSSLVNELIEDAMDKEVAEWTVITWAKALRHDTTPPPGNPPPSQPAPPTAPKPERTKAVTIMLIIITIIFSIYSIFHFLHNGNEMSTAQTQNPLKPIDRHTVKVIVSPPNTARKEDTPQSPSRSTVLPQMHRPTLPPIQPLPTRNTPTDTTRIEPPIAPDPIAPAERLDYLLSHDQISEALALLDTVPKLKHQITSLRSKYIESGQSLQTADCNARTDVLFYKLEPSMQGKLINKNFCKDSSQWDYRAKWCKIREQMEICKKCTRPGCIRP